MQLTKTCHKSPFFCAFGWLHSWVPVCVDEGTVTENLQDEERKSTSWAAAWDSLQDLAQVLLDPRKLMHRHRSQECTDMWGTKETLTPKATGAPVPPSALEGTAGFGLLIVSPLMSCSCVQDVNVQREKLFGITNRTKILVLTGTWLIKDILTNTSCKGNL